MLAAIEFVLLVVATEARRRRTCTRIRRILSGPANGCVAVGDHAVRVYVSAFFAFSKSAPPAANLLAFVAQNSSRRPRSRRPGQPRILRGDAVLIVVGEAEICVLEPAWMGGLGPASVLSGPLTRL